MLSQLKKNLDDANKTRDTKKSEYDAAVKDLEAKTADYEAAIEEYNTKKAEYDTALQEYTNAITKANGWKRLSPITYIKGETQITASEYNSLQKSAEQAETNLKNKQAELEASPFCSSSSSSTINEYNTVLINYLDKKTEYMSALDDYNVKQKSLKHAQEVLYSVTPSDEAPVEDTESGEDEKKNTC
jgi:DNA repair exonuclease SbcCD ATPase subunit